MPAQSQTPYRFARCLLRLCGSIWASPNTLLGFILGVANATQPRWHPAGVIEFHMDSGPAKLVCKKMGISAFTLGDCVLYAVAPTPNLRLHEFRHCLQYRVLGPFFLPMYYVFMATHGYWRNPLEVDARHWEASDLKDKEYFNDKNDQMNF